MGINEWDFVKSSFIWTKNYAWRDFRAVWDNQYHLSQINVFTHENYGYWKYSMMSERKKLEHKNTQLWCFHVCISRWDIFDCIMSRDVCIFRCYEPRKTFVSSYCFSFIVIVVTASVHPQFVELKCDSYTQRMFETTTVAGKLQARDSI